MFKEDLDYDGRETFVCRLEKFPRILARYVIEQNPNMSLLLEELLTDGCDGFGDMSHHQLEEAIREELDQNCQVDFKDDDGQPSVFIEGLSISSDLTAFGHGRTEHHTWIDLVLEKLLDDQQLSNLEMICAAMAIEAGEGKLTATRDLKSLRIKRVHPAANPPKQPTQYPDCRWHRVLYDQHADQDVWLYAAAMDGQPTQAAHIWLRDVEVQIRHGGLEVDLVRLEHSGVLSESLKRHLVGLRDAREAVVDNLVTQGVKAMRAEFVTFGIIPCNTAAGSFTAVVDIMVCPSPGLVSMRGFNRYVNDQPVPLVVIVPITQVANGIINRDTFYRLPDTCKIAGLPDSDWPPMELAKRWQRHVAHQAEIEILVEEEFSDDQVRDMAAAAWQALVARK